MSVTIEDRVAQLGDKLGRGDVLLSCHNGSSGGTANCLEYARERQQYEGFEIINIDPSRSPL